MLSGAPLGRIRASSYPARANFRLRNEPEDPRENHFYDPFAPLLIPPGGRECSGPMRRGIHKLAPDTEGKSSRRVFPLFLFVFCSFFSSSAPSGLPSSASAIRSVRASCAGNCVACAGVCRGIRGLWVLLRRIESCFRFRRVCVRKISIFCTRGFPRSRFLLKSSRSRGFLASSYQGLGSLLRAAQIFVPYARIEFSKRQASQSRQKHAR